MSILRYFFAYFVNYLIFWAEIIKTITIFGDVSYFHLSEIGMNSNDELKKRILDILDKQKFCVFTSMGKEYPHPTLVAFVVNKTLTHILFATSINTQKFENLQNNPKISLFFDNRMNNNEDISVTTTITAQGLAKFFTLQQRVEIDNELLKMIDEYKNEHTNLSNFLDDEKTAVIFTKIKKYQLVSKFEEIQELFL
jgi:hypothetical protein